MELASELTRLIISIGIVFCRLFPALLVSSHLRVFIDLKIAALISLIASLSLAVSVESQLPKSSSYHLVLVIVGNLLVGAFLGFCLAILVGLVAMVGRAADGITGARSLIGEGSGSEVSGLESFFILLAFSIFFELEACGLVAKLALDSFGYISPTFNTAFGVEELSIFLDSLIHGLFFLFNRLLLVLLPLFLFLLVFDFVASFWARAMPDLPVAFELVALRGLMGGVVCFLSIFLDIPNQLEILIRYLNV